MNSKESANSSTGLKIKSDQDLVKLFLEGKQVAFNELVNRYKKKVYSVARKYAFSHEAADDISQEVFITLYTKAHTYNDQYPFSPWLLKITANKSINYVKKLKYERSHSYIDEMNSDPVENNVKIGNPDPESATENQELAKILRGAIDKLHPKYRMVFSLAIMEGMSYKEISEVMGISMGTVMSRLNRARTKLKKSLQDYFKGFDKK